MADEGNGGASPEAVAVSRDRWTTGDPDKDWARYSACVDRVDAGVRHRFAVLLAFDGLLAVALAILVSGSTGGPKELQIALLAFLPWMGFAVSLVVCWAQYRASKHRSQMALQWQSSYPAVAPSPFGHENKAPSSVAFTPPAVAALASVIMWIGVAYVILVWNLVPWSHVHGPWSQARSSVLEDQALWATLLLMIAAIVVLYSRAATHANWPTDEQSSASSPAGKSTETEDTK